MEVAILGEDSLRIKGKKSSLVVNPTKSTNKTEAEASIFLRDYETQSIDKIEGMRISIKGPGEYEVGGNKISAAKIGDEIVCFLDVDNVKIVLGHGKSLEKIVDKVETCNLLVVNAAEDFNTSVLTSLEPNVILIYGPKKEEVGKSLGKESLEKSNKYVTTADKLPEDLQVALLG